MCTCIVFWIIRIKIQQLDKISLKNHGKQLGIKQRNNRWALTYTYHQNPNKKWKRTERNRLQERKKNMHTAVHKFKWWIILFIHLLYREADFLEPLFLSFLEYITRMSIFFFLLSFLFFHHSCYPMHCVRCALMIHDETRYVRQNEEEWNANEKL